MKTRIFFIAALAMLASACQKELVSDAVQSGVEPVVISTGDVETKTALDGTSIVWSADDKIAVFDKNNVKNLFAATSVNGSKAEFTGVVTEGTTQIYAVYPYELAKSANGSTLTVTVLADQTSKAGSFAEEHNISVAKATKEAGDSELPGTTFKNVCGLLKFTVPTYVGDVTAVTVTSKSVIAGEMTVDYSGDAPVATVAENGIKTVSMTGEFAAGSTFWFVLAPVQLDGVTVNVTTAQGSYAMTTDAAIQMTAGKYKNLGTLELEEVTLASATAAHVYENNVLTGTEVNVNLGLDATTAKYVSNVTLQVVSRTENDRTWWESILQRPVTTTDVVLRETSVDNVAEVITMPAGAEVPYLPAGEYVLTGSYKFGDVEKTLNEIAFTVGAPFTGEGAPAFKAVCDVYTSYDKFVAGDVDGANELNGSAIYANVKTANVSAAILEQYNSLVKASFTFDGDKTVEGDGVSAVVAATGKEFGEYSLVSVTTSFDGGAVCTSTTEAGTYHVTGIPFSYEFTEGSLAKFTEYGWTMNGAVKENIVGYSSFGDIMDFANALYLSIYIPLIADDSGFAVSPRFHIPDSSIKVETEAVRYAYDVAPVLTTEFNVYVGPVAATDAKYTSDAPTFKSKTETTAFNSIGVGEWATFELSKENPYYSISSNRTKTVYYAVCSAVNNSSLRYAK